MKSIQRTIRFVMAQETFFKALSLKLSIKNMQDRVRVKFMRFLLGRERAIKEDLKTVYSEQKGSS